MLFSPKNAHMSIFWGKTGIFAHEIFPLKNQFATCLQVNKGKYQIEYALNSCAEQGGALAVPTNLADNTLFTDLVGYNKGYDLWVGISDVETEGKYIGHTTLIFS